MKNGYEMEILLCSGTLLLPSWLYSSHAQTLAILQPCTDLGHTPAMHRRTLLVFKIQVELMTHEYLTTF